MSEFPYTEPISEYIQGYQIGFEDGKAEGTREFVEWCVQNNINFSHCEDSNCDNCTRTICRNAQTYTDVVLAEWRKEQKNE